jgi:hypothetical protein
MCLTYFRAASRLFKRQIREFSEFQHLHKTSSIRSTHTHAQSYNHYDKKGEVYIKTRVVKKWAGLKK